MKKLNRNEKIWIGCVLVLALFLGGKSYWLDSWSPQSPEEHVWLGMAQTALQEEPDSWFLTKGILLDRIVAVKETTSGDSQKFPVIKITVRSYVGGYLPIGDRKLTVPISGGQ